MAADIARVLLILQAGLSLLAALGMVVFRGLSHLFPPSGFELIALGGAVLLLALGLGAGGMQRPARLVIVAVEVTTLLGGAFKFGLAGLGGLTLVGLLSGLALPVAILICVSGRVRPASRTLTRRVLGGLLLLTGVVHLALVPDHLAATRALGVLFALDGAALCGLGLATVLAVGAWWRRPAIALLCATLLAYVVVVLRATEPVDDLAMATKLIELLALGILLMARRLPSRTTWRSVGAAISLLCVILVTGSLTWAAALRPQRAVSGGAEHAMPAGTVLQAEAPPTPEQRAAADTLLEETRAGISRFADISVARAEGYRPTTPVGGPTVHYGNAANRRAALLDPVHPQALVYATTRSGPLLLGAMYMMPNARTPGLAIGGALTEWHVHTNLCFSPIGQQLVGIQSPFETCPLGTLNAPTPPMLHVWTVSNPTGAFGELDRGYLAQLVSKDV